MYTLIKEYFEILKNTKADVTEVTKKTKIALKHALTYKDFENSDCQSHRNAFNRYSSR